MTSTSELRMDDTGLWRRVYGPHGPGPWQWVCARLKVLGLARDSQSRCWSLVIEFRDLGGKVKTRLIPFSALATNKWIKLLLSAGLSMVTSTPKALDGLYTYLTEAQWSASVRYLIIHGARGDDTFVVDPPQQATKE